jgi:hypothetical protein
MTESRHFLPPWREAFQGSAAFHLSDPYALKEDTENDQVDNRVADAGR